MKKTITAKAKTETGSTVEYQGRRFYLTGYDLIHGVSVRDADGYANPAQIGECYPLAVVAERFFCSTCGDILCLCPEARKAVPALDRYNPLDH